MSPPRSDDARDGRDRESEPFRLEPESERGEDEKVLDPPGTGTRGPGTPRFAPYEPEADSKRSRRDRDEGSDGEKKVSTATVRERRDPSSRSAPGPLPEPQGWPREAFTYPLRGTGVVTLAVAAAILGLADVLTVANAWLGALVKGILLLAVLSFQVRAVAATATGNDRLPRFAEGSDFEPEALKELLFFALRLFFYLLPAFFLWLRPFLETPRADPLHGPGQWLAIGALAAAALALAPILLLSTALRYRGLSWPWRAFPWLARGLVPCLTVGAGWAVVVAAELVVAATSIAPFISGWLTYTALRFVVLWFLMVGARGLGVLGRRFPL